MFSRMGPTASLMALLAHKGNRPRPATQAIRQITATDIQRLYNTLNGKSQSYISKFCTTIRGIFRAAVALMEKDGQAHE